MLLVTVGAKHVSVLSRSRPSQDAFRDPICQIGEDEGEYADEIVPVGRTIRPVDCGVAPVTIHNDSRDRDSAGIGRIGFQQQEFFDRRRKTVDP